MKFISLALTRRRVEVFFFIKYEKIVFLALTRRRVSLSSLTFPIHFVSSSSFGLELCFLMRLLERDVAGGGEVEVVVLAARDVGHAGSISHVPPPVTTWAVKAGPRPCSALALAAGHY